MAYRGTAYRVPDFNFPEDFYLDDVGVWRLKKEKLAALEHTKPLTNEEWLRSCNTEQLAEFFIKAMLFYDNAGITLLEAIKNAVEDKEKLGSYFMESVLEWLKQPHQ